MECKHFEFPVTYFVILRRPWMAAAVLVFENPAALRGISNEALRIEESSGTVYPVRPRHSRIRFRNARVPI